MLSQCGIQFSEIQESLYATLVALWPLCCGGSYGILACFNRVHLRPELSGPTARASASARPIHQLKLPKGGAKRIGPVKSGQVSGKKMSCEQMTPEDMMS